VVAVVGAIDLTLTVRRKREPSLREAALCTVGVVTLGALFGVTLAVVAGGHAAGQFYAGWLTEYSLSLDNLFVFVLLIGRSAVPAELRSRVLLLGIGLALVLRALFIAAGAAALNRFDWVLYIFGAILLFTAGRLAFTSVTEHGGGLPKPDSAGPKIFGRQLTMRSSRAPFLALVGAIAITDLVFALDSIPAVFGLTRDPYMVFVVNAFALLGLRHLYFLIGGLLDRLVYLSAGLAAILGFIGFKLITEALLDSGVHHVGPVPVPHIGTGLSLAVIGGMLIVVTAISLLSTRGNRLSRSRPAPSAGPRPHQGRPSESRQLPARSVPRCPQPGRACPPSHGRESRSAPRRGTSPRPARPGRR
jgi:tellurite resistance protein TerC